jgi:hypothetical protein
VILIKTYDILRGKIAEKKKLLKLTNADLSQMTGIPKGTVEAFTAGNRESENTANAIARVLEIER